MANLHIQQAAARRHTRVHPSSAVSTCHACIQSITTAAQDLKIEELWTTIDGLWGILRRPEVQWGGTGEDLRRSTPEP